MICKVDRATRVIDAVRRRISQDDSQVAHLSASSGIPASTIREHATGASRPTQYAVDRYGDWLRAQRDEPSAQEELGFAARAARPPFDLEGPERAPDSPWNVVDLFSGCGGLSLGFEMYSGGAFFRTVLAMDIEQPMVDVFNENSKWRAGTSGSIARRVDLEQFSTDAEILAFYLDHYAHVFGDEALASELERLPTGPLSEFKRAVWALDRNFWNELQQIRQTNDYRVLCKAVAPHTFSQTSIEELHRQLQLPLIGTRWVEHPVIWSSPDQGEIAGGDRSREPRTGSAALRAARTTWNNAVRQLSSRNRMAGKGPARKAQAKISSFLTVLEQPCFRQVHESWVAWWAKRSTLRHRHFTRSSVETTARLRQLYEGRRSAHVILGGPPCQGFSRVGRGKLRSLREHGAHIQANDDAGDQRNLLLHKYVQFVSALRPHVFLFENVASFESSVRTRSGVFDAVTTLQEAIEEISNHELHYEVSMGTLQCSEHGIPQFRARFFMAGVRDLGSDHEACRQRADQCLRIPKAHSHVPLRVALSGLSEASLVDGTGNRNDLRESTVAVRDIASSDLASRRYFDWIQQPLDGSPSRRRREWKTDAHTARRPRKDDGAWFRRMGPGMRWMDYRCDGAATLQALRLAVETLTEVHRRISSETHVPAWLHEAMGQLATLLDEGGLSVDELGRRADGSLSIRLLLEAMTGGPGLPAHHLLRDVYLSKRSGHHGDWLKRLDPDAPCRTVVSHMAKDAYPYVHPSRPRTLSVREAARIQSFPDAFTFGAVGMFYAYRVIGNAVPPLLSNQLATSVSLALDALAAANLGANC
ncbi:MAG: DNA cytosine methyltransferase [Planctomycetes bacterium]|nr:DNA cytosine methyltransferase [Planctomycetota bacterium]